ncbi:hypothetical protein ACIOFV_50285 [Streptomyces mirabilis]|uniref:hypothetical protein n=1 Tax=Streptomyces mirabilis TaxID=68239 RepID=UPI00382E05A9
MTDVNEFDIPTGPIDREPLASRHRGALEKEVILRDALLAAGVDPGEYDARIIHWFAEFADWSTFAVMTSWVQRAAQAAKESRQNSR